MKGIQASNVIIISYVYIYITGNTSYFDIWNVEGKRRATKYVLSNICIFISLVLLTSLRAVLGMCCLDAFF